MALPSEIAPDTLLAGKIRLLQRIGRGGMGDVWMARNEATHAEVAVKTLQKSERTAVHDERLRREARLAATISHRNVVRIFDLVDGPDGTLGLVMELLRGGTLETCVRDRGAMSSAHAIAFAVPILTALNHVHQRGIVHRDVKPANLFFAVEPDGHVIPKILDFGIAKLPAAGSSLTLDGSVLGTPHYMSPEQIRGMSDLDGRSDMFSLAIVLYEMLTGVRPFQRDSAAASLAAVLEHEVDPDPRIEPRLWVAISRALAKRPYERFATCAEFADALRSAIDEGDGHFATALQELRPRGETGHEMDLVTISRVSSSQLASTHTARALVPKARTMGWAVVVSAVVALTIAGALAVSRSEPRNERAANEHAPAGPTAPMLGAGQGVQAASLGMTAAFPAPPSPGRASALSLGDRGSHVVATPLAVASSKESAQSSSGLLASRPTPVARPAAPLASRLAGPRSAGSLPRTIATTPDF